MCPCCDPTSEAGDPVVVRLERELADDLAKNDAWALREQELERRLAAAEAERDECRRLLRYVLDGLDEHWMANDGNAVVVSKATEAARAAGGRDES